MTLIGYAKPLMFEHQKGPRYNRLTTAITLLFTYPLLDFSRLQGIQNTILGLGTRTLLRFFPFQRQRYNDATDELSHPSLLVPRFSQPLDKS
jgi:hypothetical protein